jgi:chemosensory pili system protein ChpA (sensor histidine kinase/response regulator)
MAANPMTSDFDLGPLSWVKTEIDHSLNQARENLDKLVANAADRAPVKYILTHLHQATGALAMVGLGAATRFNEELEKLVAFLETEDAGRLPATISAAKKGVSALSHYLDTLLAGQADRPMRLLAPYLELNRARGASDANEGDLFYPDLSAALPPLAGAAPLDEAVLHKALAHQRAQYQQGLLRMLKGPDAAEALRQMHAAVTAVESLLAATPNRAFWTAASAFFDALVFGGLDTTASVKPLFPKVDQALKQLLEGSNKVAERVFRDLLLSVGRAGAVSERITTLKQAYSLERLISPPESLHASDGDEAMLTLVREVRDFTSQQKDLWLKYTSGNRAALDPFGKQAVALAGRAAALPVRDIHAVLAAIAEVAPVLKAKAIPPSEAQALEVATAILFIESALENYFRLGADFQRQAATVVKRLKGALAGEALAPMESIEGGLLDEMTRRAQEKLLIFQVGQEVQVNLQNIEQALDGFFRDPSKRPELAALPAQFGQVQGALMIMELTEAAALNSAVLARVQQFAEGSLDGTGEAAEMVADGLSALGLYITALQQGSSGAREVLMPALSRLGLIEPEAPAPEVSRTGTVSPLDIDIQKQKVQAAYEDWKDKPVDDTRVRLEKAVDDLKRDAAVVEDTTVARQSEAALEFLKQTESPSQTGVFRAIQGLAPEKPTEEPAPQVVQLVDAPGAQVDQELLEIFLEEAVEVVGTIEASLAVCRDAPHDKESLTTIRRGFHTLKGSGRMVGLDELGEMAWQCEQVMNKLLKDDRPASPAVLSFIGLARESFGEWVAQLKVSGSATIDGTRITQLAEQLKSGEAPVVEVAAAPPPVVEPPAPAEAAAPAAEAPAFSFEALGFAAPSAPQAQAPAEAAMASAAVEPVIAEAPLAEEAEEPEEPETIVGEVSLPTALFAIYLGEAAQHIAVMRSEMDRIESDPMWPVGIDFMRAAHTLASSSRTTGFAPIADLSYALELWLQEAMEMPPEFNAARMKGTRTSVDALAGMVEALSRREPPVPRDDRVAELRELCDGLRAARKTGEGTHMRMPSFLRDTLEPVEALVETPVQPVESAEPAAPIAEVVEPAPVAETVAPEPIVVEPAPVAEVIEPQPAAVPPEPVVAEPAPAAGIVEPSPVTPREVVVPIVAAAPKVAAPAIPPPPISAPAEAELEKPFEAGKDQRRIKDDVDRDLLPIFLEEAREIVPAVSAGVRRWKAAPSDHSFAAELHRHLHTLKGSARMSGLMRLGELAHVLETRIVEMEAAPTPTPQAFEEVEERVDRFSLSLERLARGEDIIEDPIKVPVSAVFEQQRDKPTALAVIAAASQEVAARKEDAPGEARESRAALLRVNAELIDHFVNDAGELSIARSRIEGEIAAFRRGMTDLTENIARMRAQLREIEMASEGQMQSTLKAKEETGGAFDPLEMDRFSRMQELTRFLAESLGDVITLHQGLQKNLDEAELAINAQARLNRELQQGLMGVRLVPLGNLGDRFYRIIRQTAKELDKKANLEIKGTRVELDRSVLEKITAPFEHLLRNAIAHGLETPAVRVAAGKPEIGEIAIDAVQRGNEVVLTVADDGAGLNFERIRQKAREAGLLAPDVELPEAQLAQFIFTSGFSTATEVSAISGRGVGLDVVRNEITTLGGRVEISSTPGRGTAFTITLPLTLAVTQAVMLRAGPTIFAVPSVMIEQVQEFKAQPYAELAARGEIAWKDQRYPLRSLLTLLGEIDTPVPARQIPVLLLKSGLQRAAIRVDEIVGNREVVVKTIGPQLSRLAGISGATVLGNGQVVLILNPVQLVHREAPAVEVQVKRPAEPAPMIVDSTSGAPLVMVVDDSLTVRKITSRVLSREGYEVATAKDGVDALQQLQDLKPDCILLDVEMPRMDGFEFARNVRADAQTRGIPIIMITSRTADKHRARAIELGVNEYMGKPYQEDQLLALIKRYTSEPAFA